MKTAELRKKSIAELEKTLAEKKKAVHEISFGATGSKVKNVRVNRNTRKEIARVKTVINELKRA